MKVIFLYFIFGWWMLSTVGCASANMSDLEKSNTNANMSDLEKSNSEATKATSSSTDSGSIYGNLTSGFSMALLQFLLTTLNIALSASKNLIYYIIFLLQKTLPAALPRLTAWINVLVDRTFRIYIDLIFLLFYTWRFLAAPIRYLLKWLIIPYIWRKMRLRDPFWFLIRHAWNMSFAYYYGKRITLLSPEKYRHEAVGKTDDGKQSKSSGNLIRTQFRMTEQIKKTLLHHLCKKDYLGPIIEAYLKKELENRKIRYTQTSSEGGIIAELCDKDKEEL